MTWTTINTIRPLTVIVFCIHNNYLQKQTRQLSRRALREIDEYYKAASKTFNAQIKFNDSTVDNAESHEETLEIIVNYIRAGEDHG